MLEWERVLGASEHEKAAFESEILNRLENRGNVTYTTLKIEAEVAKLHALGVGVHARLALKTASEADAAHGVDGRVGGGVGCWV